MKKIFTLLIGSVFALTILNAQEAPPQAFSFKATIQGANGQIVVNKMIRLRISILQDDMDGFPVYSEYFTPNTNHYSQVDVEIGRGNVLTGIFSSIDWSSHKYFLKVEVDAKGGTNYQMLSTTQLLSVPYALYAGTSGSAINETDPIFKTYPAYEIGSGDISNWDAAFGWGNHAASGYLVTEIDPAVTNNFDFNGAATNDLLNFNGTKWIPFTPNFALTNHIHDDATTDLSGFMSGSDKSKLEGLVNYSAGTGISINETNEIINDAPDQTITLEGAGSTTVTGTYPDFTISSLSTSDQLSDADGDTKIVPELTSDDDNLRFYANDVERLRITPTGNFETFGNNNSLHIGEGAGNVSTGAYNIFIGNDNGLNNTGGRNNSSVGYQALFNNTGGTQNTVYGYRALYSNTVGSYNVANGDEVLYSNTQGGGNTASGHLAQHDNTIGWYNVATGWGALYRNTSGAYNIAIGYAALQDNKTGSNNIAIGRFANVTSEDLTNANAIGIGAKVNASNNFVFGNNEVVGWGFGVFPGDAAIRVGTSGINGNGATLTLSGNWTNASDISKKYDIEDINYGLDEVLKLHPVAYKLKGLDIPDIGFIAQEVRKILPEIVYGEEGQMTMSYGQLTSVLVKAIQEQQKQINELKQLVSLLSQK